MATPPPPPSSAAAAAAAASSPAAAADAVPQMPAGPHRPASMADKAYNTVFGGPDSRRPRNTSLFRALNPELFVERAKKVSPAAWVVTGMVGFVAVSIAWTQYEYSQTTAKTEAAALATKRAAKAARKEAIHREMDMEEARMGIK